MTSSELRRMYVLVKFQLGDQRRYHRRPILLASSVHCQQSILRVGCHEVSANMSVPKAWQPSISLLHIDPTLHSTDPSQPGLAGLTNARNSEQAGKNRSSGPCTCLLQPSRVC